MSVAGKKKDSDWGSWALIVFLFLIDLWPIGLILLFFKLFGKDKKQTEQVPPPLRTESAYTAPAEDSRAKAAARKVVQSPTVKKSNARKLKIIGCILAALGLLMLGGPLDALFWSSDWLGLWLLDFLQALSIAAAGGGMFCAGVSMGKAVKRYGKYLSVMGDREAVSIAELARTLGYPENRVEKDLQKMVDKGYFGGRAYLNVELGYLFRSGQADADFQRARAERERKAQQTAQQAAAQDTADEYTVILRNIRRANDAIADPLLSAKIDRLEDITARIFKAVREDPKKRDKIGTFLNYYLPTTQKLLDSYAQFEAAGVEGENLRQAKARIERTMDSIVAGFEHQLDELYKADAMDVDSDIRVMESMLHRDTATVEQDFGLGKQKKTSSAGAQDVDLGGMAAQREE